jgi:hypothetical protein
MDRDEAGWILARLRRDETPLLRVPHFWERAAERGYTLMDARNVLLRGRMEGGPRYDRGLRNHVVRVRGRSRDGRDTRIAIAIHEVGPCFLISIVDVKQRGSKR